MRRSVAALLGVVLAAMFALVAAPASAAAPYCGIVWGSLAKGSSTMSSSPVVDIRSGRHACYDRLVLDVAGKGVGYDVRYVSRFEQDGSGFVVPVNAAGKIQIIARVPAYDVNTGRPTYLPANELQVVNVGGYSTFRQVVWLKSFEGQTTVGLGVRARLPFRVFVLDGPGSGSRLVVDVAHRW